MRATFLSFTFAFISTASAQQHCAAHLGGSWYINCKSLISYHDQPLVTFADWSNPIASINLEVYSTRHVLEAQVKNGKLVKGDPKRFDLKSTDAEFSLVDKSTGRVICILKNVPSTSKRATCQVDVWLDLYVAGEGYFHCDPTSSNDPTVTMLQGGTFSNSLTAISLH